MTPLTGLYVPGNRPDRFDKAVATGADLVILDLEDAVPPADKATARAAVAAWLSSARVDCVLQVRVAAEEDLAALRGLTGFEVRLPKVESSSQVDEVAAALPGLPVTALFESAYGVEHASGIATHPAVTRLGLGESDLASELGTRDDAVLDHARIRLLYAAKSAGLPAPMLSAYPAIKDLAGLRADTERGRALGWYGRVAIHPSQLPVIAEVFRPSHEERRWAEEVLTATADGGVTTLANGDMVDPAMVGRARAILARVRD
ncbi:HpcH/HpaI aldolase/citrate lyase family protein [Actinophytocola algeriensis]|uniref:Citrate lyase subunit beta/citryl-CoA lyase n=1 Tax=Actinophytocola algeriensis TaxID=1768010 RepID=A0A7W7VCS9_9PSEU|nr:CoA ester lyase [Actinophytocola algeriensis]MBB4905446.1 citrate lyase subunit beta/citryl-CoA lyase [Actinophytocola algeriensis]MBE1472869.1 citrate lyase subunit beta/citryl-CoA lyase [Actinophytocola algeriensis]